MQIIRRSIPSIRISGTACPKGPAVWMESVEIPTLRVTVTLDYIKIRYGVIGHNTCPAEPDTRFPAHLIMPELIPHTLVIDPVSGSKDQKKDKHSCKGKTHNIQSRFEELSQEQERISRMKSTMHHGESVIEDLNGVLSGKI